MKIYIYKGIQTKSNCQDIYCAHFAKPEIFFKSFECLKLLRRNHYKKSEEWNLLKTALWKGNGNANYPAFSSFTGWNCPGIFFIRTHTLYLVVDFPVLKHLCSTSSYPINFKKTCHVVEVKNWMRLWMPSQNAVIIVEWLSILFLYGGNALFQWVICKCS